MKICKVKFYKIIQFTRLQATNGNTRNGKRTNIKELSRPHKPPQGAPAKSVESGVKIGKTLFATLKTLFAHQWQRGRSLTSEE